MGSRLRKLPGVPPEHGRYRVSGSLEGISGPGRRTVRSLEIRHFDANSPGGLEALPAFKDLEQLRLEWMTRVDLEPVGKLALRSLDIHYGRHLDLTPLDGIQGLRNLTLIDLEHCRVPAHVRLPGSLDSLAIIADSSAATGNAFGRLVAAIDWCELGNLRSMRLRSGSCEIDLGLLAHLPCLEHLDLFHNVRHRGPGPSPLETPFRGLSRKLERLRIDADDPETLARQPREHIEFRTADMPVVYGRVLLAESVVAEDADDDDEFGTYVRLWYASEGRDGETEAEALAVAKRRLNAADPGLLRRLDFDQEADGTGITATTREDLTAALRILGLDAP